MESNQTEENTDKTARAQSLPPWAAQNPDDIASKVAGEMGGEATPPPSNGDQGFGKPDVDPSGAGKVRPLTEPPPKPNDTRFHKHSAQMLVATCDMVLSSICGIIADEPRKKYQLDDNDRRYMEATTANYMASIEWQGKIPTWLPLILAVVFVYGKIIKSAVDDKKAKKKKGKPQPEVQTVAPPPPPPPASTQKPANPLPPVVDFSIGQNDLPIFKPAGDPLPEWFGGENPVPETDNAIRMDMGHAICPECGINRKRTGEETCSQKCQTHKDGRR